MITCWYAVFRKIVEKLIPVHFTPDIENHLKMVEKRIGYRFSDRQILFQALKHKSYLVLSKESYLESNERLEFLGDAILDLIVTEYLYAKYPGDDEGALSQKRSILVSRKALGELSQVLEYGDFLFLNYGEEKTGGRQRNSNLANLYEAVIAAVYLDGGYKQAVRFFERTLLPNSQQFLNESSFSNYKSVLLELSQARDWSTPEYIVASEEGPDHQKMFEVKVIVNKEWQAAGTGSSKKRAEQEAAHKLIEELRDRIELPSKIKNLL